MMNNLLALPLIIPICTAIILVFLHGRIGPQRIIGAAGSLLAVASSVALLVKVKQDGIQTLAMGGWAAPYGIVFVADMLAALLVLATSVIGLGCLVFSFRSIGEDRERHYFYPLFQFLIAGVSGSFLTGDIFNLFVCFEVMLIASYALLVLGGRRGQLRESIKYMVVNILSSALFVAAVAYLYGMAGTLNFAHLSERVAEAGQSGAMDAVAVLFLIVFSLKAGLLLFQWLPGSYAAPPTAVAALFGALLTKVGLYALLRVFTLVFPQDYGNIHSLIGWMAGATMVLGALGALAKQDVRSILNYNVVISVGFIAFGLAVSNKDSLDGVVYYLLHDMAAKALLFLLGGMTIAAAGTSKLSDMGGLIRRHPWIGWMFFVTTLAIAGIPPLSGFPGKLLIIRGGFAAEQYVLAAISLATSFIVLYSLVRIFVAGYWGEEKTAEAGEEADMSEQTAGRPALLVPTACLLILVAAMGIAAEPLYRLAAEAGDTLLGPAQYIEAVLQPGGAPE